MKYFTLRWWQEGGDEKYNDYLESIRPRLPVSLALFANCVSLHDAQVIHLRLDVARGELELVLDALRPSDGPDDVEHYRLTLVYEGVSLFLSTFTPEEALGGPAGYGELGYSEIELLTERLFEQRFLFSSSIELQIQFKNLRWMSVD